MAPLTDPPPAPVDERERWTMYYCDECECTVTPIGFEQDDGSIKWVCQQCGEQVRSPSKDGPDE